MIHIGDAEIGGVVLIFLAGVALVLSVLVLVLVLVAVVVTVVRAATEGPEKRAARLEQDRLRREAREAVDRSRARQRTDREEDQL